MRDNTYYKNPNQKQAIFVPINRKTVDPNEYKPVDTKLNGDEGRRVRRGYGEDAGDDYEEPKKDRSQVYAYDPSRQEGDRDRELDRER